MEFRRTVGVEQSRMIRINRPEVQVRQGTVTLSARIVVPGNRFPETLWFAMPERFTALCSAEFEPFVVALSSLASSLDEEITFEGNFCERLAIGLDEYWTIISGWEPSQFRPLKLRPKRLVTTEPNRGVAGAAFSGGVDSFFTQFLGLQRSSGFKPAAAVFIHGLDIPLADRQIYERAADAYETCLSEIGVDLIRVESNVRAFVPSRNWGMGHGSALCGTALVFSGGINRFFVPSSKSYTTLEPWGSDPLIDGLLSSDRMQIIHDGARYTRFDKLQVMKDWQPLRALLRTCYEKPDAFHNCGECQNCRRTMMILDALGVLEDFPTFPRVRTPYHFVNSLWETPHERLFGAQAISYAEANGRSGTAWAGRVAMQTSRVRTSLKRVKTASRPLRHRLISRWSAARPSEAK